MCIKKKGIVACGVEQNRVREKALHKGVISGKVPDLTSHCQEFWGINLPQRWL